MNEIVDKVVKFRDERDWKKFHSPNNLAKSICLEASELLECFQWSDECEDIEHIAEELADVLIYSISMADIMGFDISQIIEDKLKKNAKKYPVDKCSGKSDKYDCYIEEK